MPLLLTNGWPSSFLEYTNVISPLTDPESHGGDAGESFTVVIPFLPGFGFSAPPPPETFSATEVATLWHQLMTVGLGFEKYLAHGSDLGAGVTARLARTHPEAVVAIHLATPGLAVPPGPCSPAEEQHRNETDAWVAEEGGYAHIQSTKPSTLGAALNDSPLGLAAWIGEKIMAWSSPTAHGEPAEVVPFVVEFEVAVPRLTPASW